MAKVRFASPATEEFSEALAWYMARDEKSAAKFDAAISEAADAIAAGPLRYPKYDKSHHFFMLAVFPYQLIYRVLGDEVVVIAVAHLHRQPGYWTGR